MYVQVMNLIKHEQSCETLSEYCLDRRPGNRLLKFRTRLHWKKIFSFLVEIITNFEKTYTCCGKATK